MTKSDDAKKKILARRATFVAAALAGISSACGKENAPHPCLSQQIVLDDSGTPQPCLTPVQPSDPDAQAPDDAAPPRPCLKIKLDAPKETDAGTPVPVPHPCLTPKAPPR